MSTDKFDIEKQLREKFDEELVAELETKSELTPLEIEQYLATAANKHLPKTFQAILEHTSLSSEKEISKNNILGKIFYIACNAMNMSAITLMLTHQIKLDAQLLEDVLEQAFEELNLGMESAEEPNPKLLHFLTYLLKIAELNNVNINLNWHTMYGRTPLSLALEVQNKGIIVDPEFEFLAEDFLIRAILKHNIDLNLADKDIYNEAPLFSAIRNQQYQQIPLLIEAGAKIDFDKHVFDPLRRLAQRKETFYSLIAFKHLLENVSVKTLMQNNPEKKHESNILKSVIYWENAGYLSLLMQHAGRDLIKAFGSETLFFAIECCSRRHNTMIPSVAIPLLIQEGVSLNSMNQQGLTAIEYAASLGLTDIMAMLKANGASVGRSDDILFAYYENKRKNAQDAFKPLSHTESRTLDQLIKEQESKEYIEEFLKSHSLRLNDIQHGLFMAAAKRNNGLCRLLMEWGANAEETHQYLIDLSATDTASYLLNQLYEMMEPIAEARTSFEKLKQERSSISKLNEDSKKSFEDLGELAQKNMVFFKSAQFQKPVQSLFDMELQITLRPKLLRAIMNDDAKAVTELVSQGADPNFVDYEGGHTEYVSFSNGGAALNLKGYSPLHLACLEGKPRMFNLLIELGANIEIANSTAEFFFKKPLKRMSHFAVEQSPLLKELILRAEKEEAEVVLAKNQILKKPLT